MMENPNRPSNVDIYQQYSNNQFADLIMSNAIGQFVGNLRIREINYQTILILILLMGLNEVKSLVHDFMIIFRKRIGSQGTLILKFITNFLKYIFYIYKNKFKKHKITYPLSQNKSQSFTTIDLKMTPDVINLFYKFLQENKGTITFYDLDHNYKIDVKNYKEHLITIGLKNIKFRVDNDTTCYVKSNLILSLNNNQNSIANFRITNQCSNYNWIEYDQTHATNDSIFLKLVYDKDIAQQIFIKVSDWIKNNFDLVIQNTKYYGTNEHNMTITYINVDSTIINYPTKLENPINPNTEYYEIYFWSILKQQIPQFSVYEIYYIMEFLHSRYDYNNGSYVMTVRLTNEKTIFKIVNDKIPQELTTLSIIPIKYSCSRDSHYSTSHPKYLHKYKLTNLIPNMDDEIMSENQKILDSFHQNEDQNSITIEVKSDPSIGTEIILQKFMNYYNHQILQINHQLMKINHKVGIYQLYIEDVIHQNTIDNPEYVKLKDQLILMSKLEKDTNKNIDLSDISIPPKIIQNEMKREIKLQKISDVSKPIETLYLRNDDQHNLINLLDRYKNNGMLYEKLGLPKKLGILLHGPPGTGKSTTIKAIATFLNKGIYYMDLKGVKNNMELKMLFDYVDTHCENGVIVFEDIDAMTDIVLNRDQNENNLIDTLKQTETLTLSYLLNLLDGTLSREDTIFIITTNHKDRLDPAIYRSGRCDTIIELLNANHDQIRKIFEAIMGQELDSNVLQKISEYQHSPAEFIFHVIKYVYHPDISHLEIMQPFLNVA